MPKVSASIGFTINLGNYQSCRIEAQVLEIDTSMPIDPQLKAAFSAYDAVFDMLEDVLRRQLDQAMVAEVRSRG